MIYYLPSVPFHSMYFTVTYIIIHYDTIYSIEMYLNVTTRMAYYSPTFANWPISTTKYELNMRYLAKASKGSDYIQNVNEAYKHNTNEIDYLNLK